MQTTSSAYSPARLLLGLLALALALVLSTPSMAGQSPMKICYPDFWPFFHRQEDGHMTGFFHDIVTEALDRMEIQATWTVYPWPRCQHEVRTGESDAMVTFPSAERLGYTKTHPEPFYEKKITIFTYVRHPRLREIQAIETIDDILKLNLTVITYAGNGWNDKNIKTRGIKTYDTAILKNVWRMLANKRGDVVIEWPGGAWPDIHATGTEDIILQTGVTLEAIPFHLMIGKSSPYAERLPEFNQVILDMKKNGTLDRIVDKYIKQYQANPSLPPLSGPQQTKDPSLTALLAH